MQLYIRAQISNNMRKITFILCLLIFTVIEINAQESFKLYNEEADAQQQILDAAKKAREQNKNVFLFIGGNWCRWCKMFNEFATTDTQIDSAFKAGYMEL